MKLASFRFRIGSYSGSLRDANVGMISAANPAQNRFRAPVAVENWATKWWDDAN